MIIENVSIQITIVYRETHNLCHVDFCCIFCSFVVDGTSASLSCLQGVVATSQVMRNQGPSLTPSLANYFRADLIAHVMNWPAEILEKQVCVPVMTHTFNGSLTFAERFILSMFDAFFHRPKYRPTKLLLLVICNVRKCRPI